MFRQRFLGEICLAREFGKVQDYNLGTCFITLFWKDLFGLKVWWQQGYHHTYVIALHLISSLLFFDWLLQVVMSPMGITFLDVYILKWHLIWAELYGGLYLHLVLFDFDKKKWLVWPSQVNPQAIKLEFLYRHQQMRWHIYPLNNKFIQKLRYTINLSIDRLVCYHLHFMVAYWGSYNVGWKSWPFV